MAIKCPFTGLPVKVRQVKAGSPLTVYWFGTIESPMGGYSTTLFQTEQHLTDFFNLRKGELTAPSAQPKIEVRHPDYLAGTTIEDENQKERDLDEASKKAATGAVRKARDTGVIRPAR